MGRRALASVAAILALAIGCGSSGSGGPRASSASVAGATSATTTTSSSPAPTGSSSSSTSTKPQTPPPPPPATTGSGGTTGTPGTFTRTVTTAAQPGLPPIQVDYKVYVPASYSPGTPIAMVLSELTPLSYWQPIAQSEGFMVVEQQGYLGNGGFTFDYDVLVLNAILDDTQATWNVDTKRIYLTGFSAGAHWSYVVGLANSDQFGGLGICAGSMSFAIQLGVWPSQVTTKIAVAIRHGTQDTVVPVTEGRDARTRLTTAGHPVDYAEFTGGHTVTTQELTEIWAFLKDKRRP